MTEIDNSISDIDIGKPEYWSYKGEGAMNIVLSYNGPRNELLDGLVLRVKKLINGSSHNLKEEIELYDFVLGVMTPLLGDKYVFSGKMIKITKEFLEKLDHLILDKRPIKRSTNGRIDTNLTIAFLIMDLTRLDNNEITNYTEQSPVFHHHQHQQHITTTTTTSKVICIEIKPKWGFLPKLKEYMNKEYCDIKTSTCRYCMHQQLKLKEGSISDISNYCPIDLFSGDINRQKESIKQLIYNPQNNLKVYCDGVLSFTGSLGGGNNDSKDKLINLKLLSNLLINNNIISTTTTTNNNDDDEINISILSTIITSILQKEEILNNIKKVQLFDDIDIEGIYYLYQKLFDKDNSNNEFNDDGDDKFKELNNLLKNEKAIDEIKKFMISCTAKDCSIMISFNVDKPINSNNSDNNFNFINSIDTYSNNNINSNNINIQYKIGVVDLDSKKMKSIPKYYKLDQDILKLYKLNTNKDSIKSCK